jgi:hypothetical protein
MPKYPAIPVLRCGAYETLEKEKGKGKGKKDGDTNNA